MISLGLVAWLTLVCVVVGWATDGLKDRHSIVIASSGGRVFAAEAKPLFVLAESSPVAEHPIDLQSRCAGFIVNGLPQFGANRCIDHISIPENRTGFEGSANVSPPIARIVGFSSERMVSCGDAVPRNVCSLAANILESQQDRRCWMVGLEIHRCEFVQPHSGPQAQVHLFLGRFRRLPGGTRAFFGGVGGAPGGYQQEDSNSGLNDGDYRQYAGKGADALLRPYLPFALARGCVPAPGGLAVES